ncbi:putative Interferon-inducible GTPase 5-like protein [Naja naja]|nr:putative Interferon-inducible GTPase 5-like protein [Naja naja]
MKWKICPEYRSYWRCGVGKSSFVNAFRGVKDDDEEASMSNDGNLVLKDFVRREFEDLKSDLNKGNIPKVAAKYQKRLNEMENLPLNIAVTGDAGVGKSSFVNAFRDVKDDDEEASMVDAIEGTMEPKPYPHPSFPNIKIWDLPNRTPKFQAKEYLKKVNFERYDIFIMVISERFTENNAFLAKEIQRMKKKLYYVLQEAKWISVYKVKKRNNTST